MAWTALGFIALFVALSALTIHLGGNARAPDEQVRAVLAAIGALTSLVAALVCGVLAVVS